MWKGEKGENSILVSFPRKSLSIRIMSVPGDALSVAQDQFLHLYQSLPSDVSRRNFSLWLRDSILPDLISNSESAQNVDRLLKGRECLNKVKHRTQGNILCLGFHLFFSLSFSDLGSFAFFSSSRGRSSFRANICARIRNERLSHSWSEAGVLARVEVCPTTDLIYEYIKSVAQTLTLRAVPRLCRA
jgi:hypothetical protein